MSQDKLTTVWVTLDYGNGKTIEMVVRDQAAFDRMVAHGVWVIAKPPAQ